MHIIESLFWFENLMIHFYKMSFKKNESFIKRVNMRMWQNSHARHWYFASTNTDLLLFAKTLILLVSNQQKEN